jgi:uncharacterized protein (TIGR02270 family)
VQALQHEAVASAAGSDGALRLLMKVADDRDAAAVLQACRSNGVAARTLCRGAGAAGDPRYVPWLVKQMDDAKLARVAGESFSLVTGLDLAYLDLDRRPPDDVYAGPTENPQDDDVAMAEDDGLPWPDVAKIDIWWRANAHRFEPGVRNFMGRPPSAEHCRSVLATGLQRQRIAAAQYLCLLAPGTPLFNTAAPAWRQQRLLSQMSA